MINSIKYFEEKSIPVFEKLEEKFFRNPTDIASYILGITEELHKLGLLMVKESLELMNEALKESGKRAQDWVVEKNVKKQLLTSLGTVDFEKTLFTNKDKGDMMYLLDKILGFEKGQRMTEDAKAKILEEAVQTSYRRGGENASLLDGVTKQTVKRLIHNLEIPKTMPVVQKKREVEYLYIDADEDHVSLQFHEKKGDITIGENHRKDNCVLAKLVYVYEGVEPESPRSKRNRLINPYYFCRVCDGRENEAFWDEIYEYLSAVYDLDKVKKIYLNADGGGWIKTGKTKIHGLVNVLDEFHLQKYMLKLTGHLLDEAEETRKDLYKILVKGTKPEFEALVERIDKSVQSESGHKRIREAADYILRNWMSARTRLVKRDGICGCSAEGHVSHVLSARMSSRPMGWSKKGAAKMAELRAYYYNKGDMLELVRMQKKELKKAAGAEELCLSACKALSVSQEHHSELRKYIECISHSVSVDSKKKAWFRSHIWGL